MTNFSFQFQFQFQFQLIRSERDGRVGKGRERKQLSGICRLYKRVNGFLISTFLRETIEKMDNNTILNDFLKEGTLDLYLFT